MSERLFCVEKKKTVRILTQKQLEEEFQFRYRPGLDFQDFHIVREISEASEKLVLEKKFTPEQIALGALYQQQVLAGDADGILLRWIDHEVGWGIFANRAFKENEFVAEYAGLIRKFGSSDSENRYCFQYHIVKGMQTPFIIDAQDQGGLGRFVNHSYRPNLIALLVSFSGVSHTILVAKKAIAKGEQLSYNYGLDYWKRRARPRVF